MVLGYALAISACRQESPQTKEAPATPPQPRSAAAGSGAGPATAAPVAPARPREPPDANAKVQGVMNKIKRVASEPAVVKAVKDQNGKKLKPEWIREFDKEWTGATGITDKMKPYLDSACAKSFEKHVAELPALVEAFAMDNQGALVCSMDKTSDFWQGDEDKWQKAYADGKGSDFIDKPKFDDSSQTYSVQVSVPVLDGRTVIGAITVGLAMEKL